MPPLFTSQKCHKEFYHHYNCAWPFYTHNIPFFKKTGSFLSFQWKKKNQPKKSNFKISALNHEVALNQVLHLECVDKKEIRGKFCTCFWWIFYMLNTWVLQSFLNLIKDIQLITDVKRSLHTKWHLPKFGHVEKWNFFLQ